MTKLKDTVKDQAHEIAELKSLKQPKDTSTVHVPLLKQAPGAKRTEPQSLIQTQASSSVDDANLSSDQNEASFAERESETKKIRRRGTSEQGVAFFATLDNNVDHLGHNQNVVFEKVITNTGNAYNPHLGAFVAPVAGIYVFSSTITTNGDHTSDYGIFRNGVQLTILWVNGATSSSISTSNTAVLQLAAGDDVEVRCTYNDHSVLGSSHSMFSGFLLQESLADGNIIG